MSLCLACASSILAKEDKLHITQCCNQTICSRCIQANPRLATYNPCLFCLGGVDATRPTSNYTHALQNVVENADQSPADEEIFVLGADSDGESQDHDDSIPVIHDSSSPQPTSLHCDQNIIPLVEETQPQLLPDVVPSKHSSADESPSRRYYINTADTIHGIALRLGVDARQLCRVNNLPPSTLSTTPHLLHTRVFLELPKSIKPIPLKYVLSEEDQALRDGQRAREQAERRLQMVTKETDWRVAKTYVALAEDPKILDELETNRKILEKKVRPTNSSTAHASSSALGANAVDIYLDDDEWEQNERREGRAPDIPRFPVYREHPLEKITKNKWWSWKS